MHFPDMHYLTIISVIALFITCPNFRKWLMPFVEITHLDTPFKIHYELHGAKEAPVKILFITGLVATIVHWQNQIEYFAQKADVQCLYVDNRGTGLSDFVKGRYTSSSMAQDMMQVLQHVGWRQDVNVVAVSMGGMIAQELVLSSPEMFKSLVLTSTFASLTLPPLQSFAAGTVASLAALIHKTLIDPIPAPFALHPVHVAAPILFPASFLTAKAPATFDPTCIPRTNVGYTMQDVVINNTVKRGKASRLPDLFGFGGQLACILTHSVSPARLSILKECSVKILVVHGDADAIVSVDCGYALSLALDAQIVVFPQGGHTLPEQCPDEFNRVVNRFILN